MRVAFHVSALVVYAVRGHPEKWAAFQRQRGADSQKIFHPFISLEAAMREQAVISHADAEAAGDPPQGQGGEKALPGKHEEGNDGAHVECRHEKCCQLADWLAKCSV